MRIAGIDPGKLGWIVILDTESIQAKRYALSYDQVGLIQEKKIVDFLNESDINMILLEKVQGRRGWGATQTFNFGDIWGQIRLIVSRYPHKMVTPQSWQKIIHDGISDKLEPKQRSLVAYTQLFPHLPIEQSPRAKKVDNNLVDALLIATYGIIKYGKSELRAWTFQDKEV